MSKHDRLPAEAEQAMTRLMELPPAQRLAAAKRLRASLSEEEFEHVCPRKLIHPEHDSGQIYDLASDLSDLLGPGDRMLLAELLYEAVSLAEHEQVHENAISDLRQRVQEIDAGTVELIPADVAFREIEESLAEFRRRYDELKAAGMPAYKAKRAARQAIRERREAADN